MKLKVACFSICLVLFAADVFAQPNILSPNRQALGSNEPIEIVSNKMEAFQNQRKIVFSGNVLTRQGDITMKTDRLTVYYKKAENKAGNAGNREIPAGGELDRIEAKGNVIITQKDLSATAEEAIYSHDNATFVMTGQPVLKQANNTVRGCKVLIYVNENRGEVVRCDDGDTQRVTAIIHTQGENVSSPAEGRDTDGK